MQPKWIALVMSVLIFSQAAELMALKPSRNHHLEILPEREEASFLAGNMRVSMETGAPLALYRVNYRVMPDTPPNMAWQYLRENAALLNLKKDLSDLILTSVRETPGGFHVRLRQQVDSYPVYQGDIVVNLDRNHTVTFVMNSYKPLLRIPQIEALVSRQEAKAIAYAYLDITGNLNFENQETVLYYQHPATYLVHQIRVVPAEDRFGDWEILVDAVSGDILRVEDMACYHGRGRVFDPDPLTRARAFYQAGGQFGDNNDNDTDSLVAQIVWRDLPDITFSGGQYYLRGPFAHIEDFEAPYKGLFTRPDTIWNFTRNPDAFEAANVYYHLDHSMRYINETLGFNLMPFQYTGGVRFDPHGLNGDDNSHYIPSTGRIAWGEGGVDDSEDPDVILHELGHGIHDWITNGNLSQVTGLSEGCGDYWAASYNRSHGFWTPANPQYHWVFQWDGHNEFWAGRVTNYSASYPGGLVGQIHTDGQIFASTLMQIWGAIGRRATDANFLEALSMLNGSSNQADAAQAFVQADLNLHGGANLNAIEYWFNLRGYNVTVPQIGPLAPADLAAYSDYRTPTAIHLSWSDPAYLANGDTLLASDFRVYIQRDGLRIDSVAGSIQQFIDNGLNDGQEYVYHIYAQLNTSGIRSPLVQASWIAGGSPIPVAPPQIAIGREGDQVSLSWQNPSRNIDYTPMDDFAGVHIYRNNQIFSTLTRSTADTGRADSSQFTYPGKGFHSWYLRTFDNESPQNLSEPSLTVITPLNAPMGDIFLIAGVPDSAYWWNDDGEVNQMALNAPSGPYALNLNGKPDGGDVVELYPTDLRGWESSGVLLSYYYQPQGQSNAPEPGDSLLVYFRNDMGMWVQVAGYPGSGVQPFQQEIIDLAAAPNGGGNYFHSQFQIRFRSIGSASVFTPNDDWFVDNVYLGVPAPLISASADTVTFDPTHVDSTCSAEVQILNLGVDSLRVLEILSTSSEFIPGLSSFTTGAGSAQSLQIIFSPNQAGYRSGTLMIVSNDPQQDTLRILLQGVGEGITGIVSGLAVPKEFALHQNYPNPFNPVTSVHFDLPQQSQVRLVIYDLLGQRVRTLIDRSIEAGKHSVTWDGSDDHRVKMASGLYICHFQAGSYRKSIKMVLMK